MRVLEDWRKWEIAEGKEREAWEAAAAARACEHAQNKSVKQSGPGVDMDMEGSTEDNESEDMVMVVPEVQVCMACAKKGKACVWLPLPKDGVKSKKVACADCHLHKSSCIAEGEPKGMK